MDKFDINLINKFVFHQIKKESKMKVLTKPTRLRFIKVTDQNVWRTKPILTTGGAKFIEIVRPESYDGFIASVFVYPENTLVETFESDDFNELKVICKEKMTSLGCIFSTETRLRDLTSSEVTVDEV